MDGAIEGRRNQQVYVGLQEVGVTQLVGAAQPDHAAGPGDVGFQRKNVQTAPGGDGNLLIGHRGDPLALHPDLVVADEPVSALDVGRRQSGGGILDDLAGADHAGDFQPVGADKYRQVHGQQGVRELLCAPG